MALRDIEPFLNLSYPVSLTLTNTYSAELSAYNIPYRLYGGDANGYGRVTELSLVDGWLLLSSIGYVSGGRAVCMGRNLQSMGIEVTDDTVAFGGARIKFGRSIPNVVMTIQGSAAMNAILTSSFPVTPALNTEYYVEWCIDMPNSLFRARVDGVEIASVAISASIKTYLKSGANYLMWGSFNTGSTSAVDIYLKDGYVLEKTPDGVMSGWLGPQKVSVLPVAEFTGPWTASEGTPVEALNTPITTSAGRLTPLVSTDADASEVTLKFDASQVTGLIKGVSMNVSMKKMPGKLGTLESTVTSGGVESAKSVAVPANAMTMFTRQLLSTKAPDGQAWTAEKLAAASIKLKPVNS